MPLRTWHVTVGDLAGVARILGMLTTRRYVVTSFGARRVSETWHVELGVLTDGDGADLLTKRLDRLPAAVEVRALGDDLAAGAG